MGHGAGKVEVRMSRLWRGVAAVALTAGLLTTLELPALAASPVPSAVTVTITAKSRIPHVTGDTLVVFKAGKFAKATIRGSITGAASGDLATLFAQPFPYKHHAAAVGSPLKLTGASSEKYSFTVAPTFATRYYVRISGLHVGRSATRVVYVTTGGHFSNAKPCARPVCTQKLRFTVVIPASALKQETAKHLYFYFGIRLGAISIPPLPKRLTLDTHAKVTKVGRLSATRFQWRITWSFRIGSHSYNFLPGVCTKDTESKDGLGLPGHHHCGDKSFSTKTVYLG
jgi:hypothetical protein